MTDSASDIPPSQAELVVRQAQRWNDPRMQRDARERIAKAGATAEANVSRLRNQLKQVEKAPGIQHKIYWLRQMAQTFADAVAPHAACVDGCAACCYQPVQVTREEAEVIARETGVRMQTPAAWSTEPDLVHVGQPCPFLRDARCTIYRHRPMACRLMFNMDADALLCQMVPGSLSHVPYADYTEHKELYVRSHLGKVRTEEEMQAALKALRMADLREFFPGGSR